MKRYILLTLLLLMYAGLHAQDNRRERIKSLKVAYLTEKLELQPDEAAAFWPVYNQYDETLFNFKRSLGEIQRRIARQEPSDISESEAKKTLQEIQELKRKIAETEHEFSKKAPELLGDKGALYLEIHEELFKRELLKKLQDRRAARGNN